MRWSAGVGAALLIAFLALNLTWLGQDRLVRDGDEEGHVGAAEMFVWDLTSGRPADFVQRALWEDMGDYPSAYPAAVGAWWHLNGGGQPGRAGVRAINLLFLVVAGGAVAAAAWSLGARNGALVGGAAVLFLPLSVGVSRHFMPEGALAASVALAIAAAAWQRRRPGAGSAAFLGLALAAGLLTKQTFVLYAALPVGILLRPHRSLLWLPLGAALAAPWYIGNVADQLAYAGSSVGYPGSPLDHLAYYWLALWQPALGPVWLALLVGAGVAAGRPRGRGAVVVGLAWLVGGILLMTLVPKKYDRLLIPLLPAVGLFIAAAVHARPRLAPAVLLGAAWTAWVSFADVGLAGPSPRAEAFHPGCVQVWLRPPSEDDLGYADVTALLDAHAPGPVLLVDPPAIPCSIQTTHGWGYHLGPYLRREGQEREVLEEGRGIVTVDFGGTDHEIPALSASYSVE
ncbi:MAG: hypothetical protein GY913_11850 [Proteobacteria bacterium]|nr:hypothetical protein [Pseudomonadota bacterium]MCP4917608.1 hypothetical protein [Pseudomonadota bacterium]